MFIAVDVYACLLVDGTLDEVIGEYHSRQAFCFPFVVRTFLKLPPFIYVPRFIWVSEESQKAITQWKRPIFPLRDDMLPGLP